MAITKKGSTASSTWAMYCIYTIDDASNTEYKITVNTIGVYIVGKTYSFRYRKKDGKLTSWKYTINKVPNSTMTAEKTDSKSANENYKTMGKHALWSPSYTITIPKQPTQFDTVLTMQLDISYWYQYRNSTKKIKTTHDADTSSIRIPITVPGISKPTCSLNVERGAKDTSGQYPMDATVKIDSFSGDSITNINLYAGETLVQDIAWYSGTERVSFPLAIPEAGTVTLTSTLPGAYVEESILFKAVAIGKGGESAQAIWEVAAGFRTVDLKAGGKGISFGEKAENEGFNCNLTATFKQGIIVPSSTPNSTKKFKITVDDTGKITATEVTS